MNIYFSCEQNETYSELNSYLGYVIDLKKHGFFLSPNGLDIGVAEPKTSYIEIEGADGKIDVTQALTDEIKYNNRDVNVSFKAIENNSFEHLQNKIKIDSLFNGTNRKMYIDDWYLDGRFTCSDSLEKPEGTFEINGDCLPYRMNNYIDTKQYTVSSTLNCTIEYTDGMNVCPDINVSANMSIVIDGNEYSLVAGDNIVPDFILKKGSNSFTLNGSGTVTITWRGGNL